MKKYTVEEIREIVENQPKECRGVSINGVFIQYENFFIETNISEAIIFYTNGEPSVRVEISKIKEIY